MSQALATEADLTDYRSLAMAADLAWTPVVQKVVSVLPGDTSLTGFDLEIGGVPVGDDPASETGLTGTFSIDSPTPLDIVSIIRSLRVVEGVLYADGQSVTESTVIDGRYAYVLTVTFDQTVYSGAFADRGRGGLMPKQLINVIGIVVSLAVIALGVFLVAVPMYLQSLDVAGQTATVQTTNQLYQAEVDRLSAEQERQAEIDASVASLRAQLPETAKLDDVFEIVASAATATGVSIQAVTAGSAADFVPRTDPTVGEGAPVAEAPAETPAAETPAVDDGAADPSGDASAGDAPPRAAGRQQIDFTISVLAADISQVTAFLDALRSGPRLLSSVTATSNRTGEGAYELQMSALTFVDAEG